MSLGKVNIAGISVSRVILGGNQFSGFSHQSPDIDREMCHYFTIERIKDALRTAESVGINTHLARADHHVMRYLMEHWDKGGSIQWLAQTCPELGTLQRGIQNAINGGAAACYLHGGSMDYMLENDELDRVPPAIEMIRKTGIPAGIAGHNPKVFEWAEQNLDVDFYLCCYYNISNRDDDPEHVSGALERFDPDDRDTMCELIQTLSKPVIHYKVFAAGRNDPKEALQYAARNLRANDAVCIGIYPKDKPTMLAENLHLLETALATL